MNAPSRKYLHEVDIVRALAILGVLTVHATALTVVTLSGSSALYPIYNFLNIAFKYGTPTFIFLSGFVLFYSYGRRPVTSALLKRFYGRRLLLVIGPYVAASFVYVTVKQAVWYGFPGLREWIGDFALRLATGTAHAHLYFVVISIQFYLMFPLLLVLFQKFRRLALHSFWLGFALQWTFVLLNGAFWHLPHKGSWAFSYFSVYLLGAGFAMLYEPIRNRFLDPRTPPSLALWLLAILWAGATVWHVILMQMNRVQGIALPGWHYELAWNVHTAASAVLLFIIAHRLMHRLPSGAGRVMANLGRRSFGIYLVHPLWLMLYEAVFPVSHPVYYHLSIGAKWLFVLAASWLVVQLAAATKNRVVNKERKSPSFRVY